MQDGKGLGFGNPISAQTVATVKAAKEARRVYRVDDNFAVGHLPTPGHRIWRGETDDDHNQTWRVCHTKHNTDLYIGLLAAILSGSSNLGHGRQGYYLPSPGSVAGNDIYGHMAAAPAKKGIVEDERVTLADDEALEAMSRGLNCLKAFVRVQLAGK